MDTNKPRRHFKEKLKLTCHNCGLEDIVACDEGKHQSVTPDKLPCAYCERNPEVNEEVLDFYSETWTLDSDKTPFIEDPNKHERLLLEVVRYCQIVYKV